MMTVLLDPAKILAPGPHLDLMKRLPVGVSFPASRPQTARPSAACAGSTARLLTSVKSPVLKADDDSLFVNDFLGTAPEASIHRGVTIRHVVPFPP